MIKIDGQVIDIGSFPDGSLLLKYEPKGYQKIKYTKITWKYENDREFLTLYYLVKHLRANEVEHIHLYMPYIPNARMDRVRNPEDVRAVSELENDLDEICYSFIDHT